MGVLECGAMAMKGYFDVFDRAIGAIEHIEGLLEKQKIPIELHVAQAHADGEHETPTHFLDRKGEMQAELASAKEMIAGACQIAQNVMADMP